MLLPFHIAIALSSVIFTGYMYFSPSKNKLKVSYYLVGATVATGTWLIIANPVHMVQSCMTGLAFIGASLFGIVLARYKLAKNEE